ncbi:MAG: hypothetical protein LUD47_03450 [Clostridia bacterium]|nr:hypothetical protein [Clostridia bacterium]
MEIVDEENLPAENAETGAKEEVDPLYIVVLKFCVEDEYVSVSAIQKKFSLSFTQSLAILDWMTKMNYVAPPHGSKPQEVLLSKKGFTALYGDQFEDESAETETAKGKESFDDEIAVETGDGLMTEENAENSDEESDGEDEDIASEEYTEPDTVIVEEEPSPDKVTMIEDDAPQEESAKIDAGEIKEWIRSAITDALGDIMKGDEEDAVVDGDITDISSGIDTSEDSPELDTSLFETAAEEPEPEEYFEPQQIDIAELIKGVVHEVLEQEGANQPSQPQYQQPMPLEYIQPSAPQYTEPAAPQYQQPAQPEFDQPPVPPQYAGPAPQYTEPLPPQYQQTAQPEYAQPENRETDVYRQTIIEQSPLYAVNPPAPDPSQQELEKEKEKEKVHENFVNFINQAPSGTNEDVNPATQNLDTDELIYTNKSEAERNYTDIIYGMYDQTVGYRQKPPEPQPQPQQQPTQQPVQQRPRPAYIVRKADEDGLTVYTAEEQAESNVKHSGPYNVGMTVFKASIFPAVYLIILAVMGYVFSDRLAVNYVYGSVYLIVGVLLLIVCALFALTGYRSHAVRPITHGYISITIVLSVIAILFICILGIALDAYTETAPIMADVVLPSLAMLAAPMYVVGFYLMSQSKKVTE